MEVATLGFEPAPQQFLQSKSAASDHWAMRPLHQNQQFWSIFLCHSHCSNLVELYLSWIQRYIWGRVAQNEYFKTVSHYLRVYSLSRYIGRSINGLVSFIAALVQPETSPAAKSNEKRMLSQASWSSGHRSFGVKTPIARISGYLSNRIFMESSLTFHLCLNSRSIVLWQSRGLYNW